MASETAQTREGLAFGERVPVFAPSRRAIILLVFALILIGFALRIALLFLMQEAYVSPHTEPMNIAVSLATTGNYADAYGSGVGPTAHCAPLLPLLLSCFVLLFGIYTPATALAAHVAASFASALAFALLPVLAAESGLPLACGVLAGLAGVLLPISFWFQISGSVDAPFTAAALVAICILVCRIRARRRFTKRNGAALGVATGLCCLLNPVILPIIIGCLVVILLQNRQRLKRMLIFCGVSAGCIVATLTPWAIRNYEVMGSLIWTRSNFWMEMHLSNNDVLTADEITNFAMPQFARMHPTLSLIERAKVKRLGEVAYMGTKRDQFLAWLSTHKRRFLALTAERFRLFWIPKMSRLIQTIPEAGLTVVALSGLALLFRSKHYSAWILGAIIGLYPPAYYLVMVTPRFRVPLEPFLFLLGGYCVLRTATALYRSRWRPSANTAFVRR
ncbi:MAG: hypothetical protein ACRD6B_09470 [Bryobacteraceae bacterium]